MLKRLLGGMLGGSSSPAGEDQSSDEWIALGNRHAEKGDHAVALQSYDRALAADPGLAVAHNNRALSLMALGCIREAWAEAEWRFQLQDETRRFEASPPVRRWHGERLARGRLLVLWEQGFGDMIQHVRFLETALERTPLLTFLCPEPLRRLISSRFSSIEVVPATRAPDWSCYEAYVPLLSLPLELGLNWESLPTQPYLAMERASKPHSIGLVWRSSAFDPQRNCSLEELCEVVGPMMPAVSVQVGITEEERALLAQRGIEDLGSEVRDYLDTAAAVAPLAAVVCVDTSIAHLAGAMGKRTLVLLNEPAAVRWMVDRVDTPWYPSMRLYRKRADEPWTRVLTAIRQALGCG